MGIDISNSLLVGCSYAELEDFIQKVLDEGEVEDEQEVLEDNFECASPYYDADREVCFYGFRLQNLKEVNGDWWAVTETIAKQFEELTGVKPRIRGGAHVW